MREGERSILLTLDLKKKNDKNRHFRGFFCNNSAHRKAGKQKIYGIFKNYMLSVGTE